MISRSAIVRTFVNVRPVGAIAACTLAFLSIGLLDLALGHSLSSTYSTLWEGSLGSSVSRALTVTAALPYVVCGIAFAIGFRAGVFNLGLEGQLLWGALGATIVGTNLDAPGIVTIPLCLLAAALAGAVWALLPAVLKATRGVNEIVSSLFLNYVTAFLVSWLIADPLRAKNALTATTEQVLPSAQLPSLYAGTTMTIGVLFVVALALGFWWLMSFTRFGYEIQTVGSNPRAAEYVGIRPARTFVAAFVVSGAIGGFAGGIEVLGNQHAVASGFSSNWGYMGIAVALIGGAGALGCLAAGFLFGILSAGGQQIELVLGVESDFVLAAQAIALVCFIAAAASMDRARAAVAIAVSRAAAIATPPKREERT